MEKINLSKPLQKDWIAGQESGIIYNVIQENADWSNYLPIEEYQRIFFDTFACVRFSALNTIEIIINRMIAKNEISSDNLSWLKEKGYLDENNLINFSDRFTANMSNTTKMGNFLTAVGDSINNNGLVPESAFKGSEATSWEDYYCIIGEDLKDLGIEFKKRLQINYDWVLCGKENIESIKYYLKQSPIQIVSTCCPGWSTDDIVKSCGIVSQHATVIYGYTDEYLKDFDSYSPFEKKLAIDYGIVWAIKYAVKEVEEEIVPKFDYVFKNKMFKGERSANVKNLQELLKLDGVYHKDIDCTGYYGNITQQAVKDFCIKYSVASYWELAIVNGRWCGSKTISKLNEIAKKY